MSEIENIKRRIFSVIPTSSLHMMEFLKLMNIRYASSEETLTAAVTCSSRPELLLNKGFVEEYCKTDEHLFMLIMHELYHIVLGHTHLFKRHTEIDNIAFDAVINAILCRMFPDKEYTSFFTSLNPDDSFPGCILRPIGKNTPNEYMSVLKNLYYTNTGTYYEVYECISKKLEEELEKGNIKYILLGNHSDDNDGESNPLIKKMLDKIIEKWPREFTVNGRDLGGKLEDKKMRFEKPNAKQQKKMYRLLTKAGVSQGSYSKDKLSINTVKQDVTSVIPDFKDRTLLAKSLNSSLIPSCKHLTFLINGISSVLALKAINGILFHLYP